MEALELRIYPDPILRETAKPVEVFDDALAELAAGMIETMHRERGIGLAAPQVGVGRRVIVALQMQNSEDVDAAPLVLVNPKVITTSKDTWELEEGCLSIPGVVAPVIRSMTIQAEYQDLDGAPHLLTATDMFARVLLHEIDHLNGRLFIDYLSSANKSLVKTKLKDLIDNAPS